MTCNDPVLSPHISAILRTVADLDRMQRDNRLVELATALVVLGNAVKHADARVQELMQVLCD